jgi:dynein heavy chain
MTFPSITIFNASQMYLNEQPDVPWTTLNYIIAEINYGGRVTDDKDVRLITAQLGKYFNPGIMSGKYDFAPSGLYFSPVDLDLADVKT